MENGNGNSMVMPVAPYYGGNGGGSYGSYGSYARGRSRTTGRYISRDSYGRGPYYDDQSERRY